MICELCGVAAPTRPVRFRENAGSGVLSLRESRSVEHRMCKRCVHVRFWRATGTLALGWAGLRSLLLTPYYVLGNAGAYLRCARLAPPAPDVPRPVLTPTAVEWILPYESQLMTRLSHGDDLEAAATRVARRAGVSPGEVVLFLRARASGALGDVVAGSAPRGGVPGLPVRFATPAGWSIASDGSGTRVQCPKEEAHWRANLYFELIQTPQAQPLDRLLKERVPNLKALPGFQQMVAVKRHHPHGFDYGRLEYRHAEGDTALREMQFLIPIADQRMLLIVTSTADELAQKYLPMFYQVIKSLELVAAA